MFEITFLTFSKLLEDRVLVENLMKMYNPEVTNDSSDFYRQWNNPEEILPERGGRVFIAKKEKNGPALGFAICYDNHSEFSKLSESERNTFLSPIDQRFIEEMNAIGSFCFISHIFIKRGHRQKGLGTKIIDKIISIYDRRSRAKIIAEDARKRKKDEEEKKPLLDYPDPAILIGVTFPGKNYQISRFFKERKFRFIDSTLSDSPIPEIRFRAVWIVEKNKFVKQINSKTLVRSANTIIPIQLNIAIKAADDFLSLLDPDAKIWISAFFHTSEEFKTKFGLRSTYVSYYDSMLHNSPPKTEYQKRRNLLEEILNWKKTQEGRPNPANISVPMNRKSFELFFLNDGNIKSDDFPSFVNPIVVNVKDSSIGDLLEHRELDIGYPDPIHQMRLRQVLSNYASSDKVPKGFVLDKSTGDVALDNGVDIQNQFQRKTVSMASFQSEQLLDKNWDQLTLQEKWEYCVLWFGLENPVQQKKLFKSAFDAYKKDHRERKEILHRISNRNSIPKSELHPNPNDNRDRLKMADWEEYLRMHNLLHESDITVIDQPDALWCHAVFPIIHRGSGPDSSVFGIWFSFTIPRKIASPRILDTITINIRNSIASHMLNIILKLEEKILQSAYYQSGVARVISRNLSHNFGSHILSHLSSPSYLENYLQDIEERSHEIGDIEQFLGYLKIRMAFIADVATSEPVASASRQLMKDIILDFNKSSIVTRLISGTNVRDVRVIQDDIRNNQSDITIQCPNGELGAHAIYVILENLIRNTAKHETDKINRNSITVFLRWEKDDQKRYIKTTTYTNIGFSDYETCLQLANKINKNYIEKELYGKGGIRNDGWGILEMKIAAAYLRKISPTEIDADFGKRPLLKAVVINSNKKYHLGFEFFLKLPRTLLIIDCGDHLGEYSEKVNPKLLEYGVKIIKSNQLDPNGAYTHYFTVVVGKQPVWLSRDNKFLPLCWIHFCNEERIIELSEKISKGPKEVISYIWQVREMEMLKRKNLQDSPDVFTIESGEIPGNLSKNSIVFDLHGKHRLSGTEILYYESYGSSGSLGNLFGNDITEINNDGKIASSDFRSNLIDSALTDIIVFDERIQKAVQNIGGRSLDQNNNSRFEQLSRMRIHIPRVSEVDLMEGLKKDEKKEEARNLLEEWLINWIDQNVHHNRLEFLVVHLGLLESMMGSHEDTIRDYLYRWREKLPIWAEIVIISGRGRPHNISTDFLFTHYSNIKRFIVEDTSKHHLCQVLYGSRARNLK